MMDPRMLMGGAAHMYEIDENAPRRCRRLVRVRRPRSIAAQAVIDRHGEPLGFRVWNVWLARFRDLIREEVPFLSQREIMKEAGAEYRRFIKPELERRFPGVYHTNTDDNEKQEYLDEANDLMNEWFANHRRERPRRRDGRPPPGGDDGGDDDGGGDRRDDGFPPPSPPSSPPASPRSPPLRGDRGDRKRAPRRGRPPPPPESDGPGAYLRWVDQGAAAAPRRARRRPARGRRAAGNDDDVVPGGASEVFRDHFFNQMGDVQDGNDDDAGIPVHAVVRRGRAARAAAPARRRRAPAAAAAPAAPAPAPTRASQRIASRRRRGIPPFRGRERRATSVRG